MVGLFCCTALHALVLCRFSSCVVIGEVTHRLVYRAKRWRRLALKVYQISFYRILSHFITKYLIGSVEMNDPIPCRSCRNIIHPNCGFWRQLRDLEAANLTRRLVESLLKASTYSRLFKTIQDYSREGYGMVWSCRKPLGFLSITCWPIKQQDPHIPRPNSWLWG